VRAGDRPRSAPYWAIVEPDGSCLYSYVETFRPRLDVVAAAAHFVASGRLGIGLYASRPVALDGWEGGNAPASP
jgi:hypothetical protein